MPGVVFFGAAMTFYLHPSTAAAGYQLRSFDHIGSTNAQALQDAQDPAVGEAGAGGFVWYVTKDQRSGRGRRGREWSTQPGNLAATLLLIHDYPLEVSATLSFVAGLSLIEAISSLLPESKTVFKLKWPNDVLGDGAKISGILLETVSLPNGTKALAIGIGVNVLHVPQGLPYAATSLAQAGYSQQAEQLLAALAQRFAENFRRWDGGRGMIAIRDRWLSHAARLGEVIRVQSGTVMLEGVFTTIDASGQLVLGLPQGQNKVISAGEVFFDLAAENIGSAPHIGQ